MIPDEVMETMLTGMEAEINRDGWEEPPFLALLLQEPGKQKMYSELLPIDFQKPAGLYLLYLAERFTKMPELPAHLGQENPGIVGLVFHYQRWANDELEREDEDLADTPGSYEVRWMMIVDCWGRHYRSRRRRGQEPRAFAGSDGGKVPISLTQMMITLVPHLHQGNALLLSQSLITLVESTPRR